MKPMHYFFVFILALVGGILGQHISLHFTTAEAVSNTVTAQNFELRDSSGKLKAQLALSREGSPALFIMDNKGVARVVLGVYPAAEGENPFLVLNDSSQNAAGLFRLVGNNQLPFLILKTKGADKSIFGLSESQASRDPFLVNMNAKEVKAIFGSR